MYYVMSLSVGFVCLEAKMRENSSLDKFPPKTGMGEVGNRPKPREREKKRRELQRERRLGRRRRRLRRDILERELTK